MHAFGPPEVRTEKAIQAGSMRLHPLVARARAKSLYRQLGKHVKGLVDVTELRVPRATSRYPQQDSVAAQAGGGFGGHLAGFQGPSTGLVAAAELVSEYGSSLRLIWHGLVGQPQDAEHRCSDVWSPRFCSDSEKAATLSGSASRSPGPRPRCGCRSAWSRCRSAPRPSARA